MKRLLLAAFLLGAAPAYAAGGGALPYAFKPDTGNAAALQRGARNYMSYCVGCHSLKYLRYNRIAKDLNIPGELLQKYLMVGTDKPGDVIRTAMPADAETWFGRVPPDLTLTTRERGPAWVYSYLMTFYLDPTKPVGVNNLVLPNVSMPHVLGELQGWQVKVDPPQGGGHRRGPPLELAQRGELTPEEYRSFVSDLTNFMVYAAEPGRNERMAVGTGVLLFIVVFWILAYLLKIEYFKDVH